MKEKRMPSALRSIGKIKRLMKRRGFSADADVSDALVVFRDGEIYLLTPNDALPFYYEYYKSKG